MLSGEIMKTEERETGYKLLGILEAKEIKHVQTKKKFKQIKKR